MAVDRKVTDEELENARKKIRALTDQNKKAAESLLKKIDQLQSAGMVTSAEEYKRKLVRLTGSRAKTIDGQGDKPMTTQELAAMQKAIKR